MDVGFVNVGRNLMEKDDCAVRAYASATGKPYHDAHELFTTLGRVPGKATPWDICFKAYDQVGKRVYPHNPGEAKKTVAQWVKENPTGTFIMTIKGHAFAVHNGVVLDSFINYENKPLLYVWEVKREVAIEAPQKQFNPIVRRSPMEILRRMQQLKGAKVAPVEQV